MPLIVLLVTSVLACFVSGSWLPRPDPSRPPPCRSGRTKSSASTWRRAKAFPLARRNFTIRLAALV